MATITPSKIIDKMITDIIILQTEVKSFQNQLGYIEDTDIMLENIKDYLQQAYLTLDRLQDEFTNNCEDV